MDDPAHLWQLAERYRPYFKKKVAGLIGSRLARKEDPSDLVQRGLLAAFRHRNQFRGENAKQWLAWLWKIIKRVAQKDVRFWHQQQRDVDREQVLDDHPSGGGCQPAADSSTPSHKAARREQDARLWAAIGQLPPDYGQVIRLRILEDLPYAEIAARMKRSVGAVRVLWTRAVDCLGGEMGGDG